MTSTALENMFFESILQEIEQDNVDSLTLLRLQTQCNEIKSFREFCLILANEKWAQSTREEMYKWQDALGLSSEKMYHLMDLKLTKFIKLTQFIVSLQGQNLNRILDVVDSVEEILINNPDAR
jgi:hypothetical protein